MNDSFDPIALREVYIILERLNMLSKLPTEFANYVKTEQDVTHEFTFNERAPLFYQISNDNTKILLMYIVEKYINNQNDNL